MTERHVTFDMIVQAVCAVGGISRLEVMADRRGSAATARLRHTCWWLARELTPLSFEVIGRCSGGRDHSSVMNGVAVIDASRAQNETFRIETDALKGTLIALQRHSILQVAAVADPLAAARRVLGAPEREAVRVPVIEIVAMARLIVATFGETDDPTPSPLSTSMEISDAA